jgi:hypothetical protein
MPRGQMHLQRFFQWASQRPRRFSKRAPDASAASSEEALDLLVKLVFDILLSSLRICLTSAMVSRPISVGALAQTLFVMASLVSITIRPSPSARATIVTPSERCAARRTATGRTKRPWAPRLNADTSIVVDMALVVSEVPLKASSWHDVIASGTKFEILDES